MNHGELPSVVILGTNEIASAVSVHLRRAGCDVILSHAAFPPVVRRGMAFHDVLFGDRRVLESIEGIHAETAAEIAGALADPDHVAVTTLTLRALVALRPPDVLVDARMQKRHLAPDFRGAARITIGLGPLFRVGMNCDVAVETKPAHNGQVVTAGSTLDADGISSRLGGVGRERFAYSKRSGCWHTPVDLGLQVSRGFVLGHLDGQPVHAPLDGVVRGIVRDGSQVPDRVKLAEIDPRGSEAKWTGVDDRGRRIAEATLKAVLVKLHQLVAAKPFAGAFASSGTDEQRRAV